MLYSIGTKVKFLHTGDQGVIIELLPGGMVMVLLDKEQMEIPASSEDLVRAEDFFNSGKGKKAVKKKQFEKNTIPSSNPVEKIEPRKAKTLGKNAQKGIFLAFEPKLNEEGEVSRYQVWLINTTALDAIYSVDFELKDGKRKSQNGKLSTQKAEPIEVLQKDQLNDTPVFSIDCRAVTTAGTGKRHQKSIKLKAQQFFKKKGVIPVLKMEGQLYEVFSDFGESTQSVKDESLKAYTKRHRKEQPPDTLLGEGLFNVYNIEERASFQTEIDLHIEQLTPHFSKLSNAEILALQMRHFRDFIADAIRLGVDNVIIIHGKGSGKLRHLILLALEDYPEIENIEGGYHQGFEFGATKVYF